jgi:DAK2 domain fusion protein YloV
MFASAASWLDRNAQAIDAINVYPVPDGDTGTNMAGTLRSAVEAMGAGHIAAGAAVRALAEASLKSARGNSGVILSQFLRGFAAAIDTVVDLDGAALAAALQRGSDSAYAALEHPVEGTILTVARDAARSAAQVEPDEPVRVLEAALDGARSSLARTPDLLPVLRQAGVVDSGGFGFVVLLEGAIAFLRGSQATAVVHAVSSPIGDWIAAEKAAHAEDRQRFGYCTEFVLTGAELDANSVRSHLGGLGDSVIVVGDATALHVHVHTADPGAALQAGTRQGTLSGVKVENMQAQHDRFISAPRAGQGDAGEQKKTSIVAVVPGSGFADVARSVGVDGVIVTGATSNPSVDELLQAIESVPGSNVILLPNHKNVVLTAEQAAALSKKAVSVLKTVSPGQGIAAALAFVPDRPTEANYEAMQAAAEHVHTIEVTRAARAARIGSEAVDEGQPIAFVDGRLELTAATVEEAMLSALTRLDPSDDAVATLYFGDEVDPDAASALAERIADRSARMDVQTVFGGQPHYDYILTVE